MLLNWGCSGALANPHLNSYQAVCKTVDKRSALIHMKEKGVRVPKFLVNYTPMVDVNIGDGIWLERFDVTGHGGRGIRVVRPGDEWSVPPAPLYVQYVPKKLEFRVHVFATDDDPRCLVRQKLGVEGSNRTRDQQLIRNTENGWVLGNVRDSRASAKAEEEAIKAVHALGLDFAAVDVIIGRDDELPYVLECNTAPGLEAEAVIDFYKSNIIRYYRSEQWLYVRGS